MCSTVPRRLQKCKLNMKETGTKNINTREQSAEWFSYDCPLDKVQYNKIIFNAISE